LYGCSQFYVLIHLSVVGSAKNSGIKVWFYLVGVGAARVVFGVGLTTRRISHLRREYWCIKCEQHISEGTRIHKYLKILVKDVASKITCEVALSLKWYKNRVQLGECQEEICQVWVRNLTLYKNVDVEWHINEKTRIPKS